MNNVTLGLMNITASLLWLLLIIILGGCVLFALAVIVICIKTYIKERLWYKKRK